MFSGTGGLGHGVETYDVHVYYFDIKNKRESVPQDLLDPKCQEHIKRLLNDPNCMGIWFALPCGTFSSARRNDGKGPKPLRSKKYVSGLPAMTGRDKKRVNSANELVRIVTKLCELCTEIGVPWVIESPRSSLIWQMPTLKKLAAKTKAEFCRYDYCQFGTDWQKPTVLMACGNPLLKINQVRCDSKKTSGPDGPSICSRTQSPHTPLTGTTTVRSAQPLKNKSKQFLTSAAEPYPKKICDHWSACIHLNWRYGN